MKNYILDASALLAIIREEPGRDNVLEVLDSSSLSIVNIVEVATRLIDTGMSESQAREAISVFDLPAYPLDLELAYSAANLRTTTRHKGLSLADRVCLALAMREDAIALTADKIWKDLDIGCKIELIQ